MKGIVLAGGKGTRMGELVRVTNKHLLPVGDVPMVYHPIMKLRDAGITDIMVVTGTEHMGEFINLLGSGKRLDVDLTYRVQDSAGGIAQALGLAERFCCGDKCLVLLGDNIFEDSLTELVKEDNDAWIMLKSVPDPKRYGVACFWDNKLVAIEEKPEHPRSNLAVTGIYCYPNDVFEVIKTLKPSKRGELEITDVNNHYLKLERLNYLEMKGYWTDAGTPESWKTANKLMWN